MARRAPIPTPAELRRRRSAKSRRILANRQIMNSLVSAAGLVGGRVTNPAGDEVGKLADVVARWDGSTYPPVSGVVVRVGRRLAFVPADQVANVDGRHVQLRSARLDLADFARRDGEVTLLRDVVDHQLVDVDGVRVVRAADLYLAQVGAAWRLVGVDVSPATLLRRLGPARWRGRPTPERVIDWAAIQPFGRPGSPLRLREGNHALHRLRPAELADLLEDLGRNQRQELLAALEPDTAADALEEMEPRELGALLRDASSEQAGALISVMEPDEAVDALRDLDEDNRARVLDAMPRPTAHLLEELLVYAEGTSGGEMTTTILTVHRDDTVAEVRERMRDQADRSADFDGVVVVDADGRLVDDIRVFELFLSAPEARVSTLVGEPWPVTVGPEARLEEVIERFIESRASSVLVVDADERPVGRILADDLIDALVRGRARSALRGRRS